MPCTLYPAYLQSRDIGMFLQFSSVFFPPSHICSLFSLLLNVSQHIMFSEVFKTDWEMLLEAVFYSTVCTLVYCQIKIKMWSGRLSCCQGFLGCFSVRRQESWGTLSRKDWLVSLLPAPFLKIHQRDKQQNAERLVYLLLSPRSKQHQYKRASSSVPSNVMEFFILPVVIYVVRTVGTLYNIYPSCLFYSDFCNVYNIPWVGGVEDCLKVKSHIDSSDAKKPCFSFQAAPSQGRAPQDIGYLLYHFNQKRIHLSLQSFWGCFYNHIPIQDRVNFHGTTVMADIICQPDWAERCLHSW